MHNTASNYLPKNMVDEINSVVYDTNEYTVVPDSEYLVMIESATYKKTKSGDGELIELKTKIAEGAYKGVMLNGFLNIVSANKTAQDIGRGNLQKIAKCAGLDAVPADLNRLLRKIVRIKSKTSSYNDKMSSSIQNYYSTMGDSGRISAPQQEAANTPAIDGDDVPWM